MVKIEIWKVEIRKKEFAEFLVAFAAMKAGAHYPLKHKITPHITMICANQTTDEDPVLFEVELEHLPNVVPLPAKGQRRK